MTAYRENARDVAGEVDSLAERVKKLEEKPAKEPSKPWTRVEVALIFLFAAIVLSILAGLVPSVWHGAWPLATGLGAAAAICLVAAGCIAP